MKNVDQKLTDSVIAAQNGDESAFTYIYESTFKYEYSIAVKLMNYNEHDAQDVLQVAYTRAFKNLKTLEKPENFTAWLSRIVHNTAVNSLRKNKPQLFTNLEVEDEEGEVLEYQFEDVNEANNPEIAYTKQETADMVRTLLEDLSPEQKMAIIMFHLEGHSIRDIAETMGCNENTVKSRLNLGRKNLKESCEKLQKKGYKLYSFSPVMLLMLLLRKDMEYEAAGIAIAMEEGAKQILGQNFSAAGGAGNGAVAEAAGNGAANSVGAAIGAKAGIGAAGLKIGLAAASLVVTIAVVVSVLLMNNKKNKDTVEVTGNIESYEEISETTRDILGNEDEDKDSETSTENPNYNEVLGFDPTGYMKILTDYEADIKAYDWQGYEENDDRQVAFTDLTEDGIPEMIIMRTDISNNLDDGDYDETAFLEIYSMDAEGNCINCEFDGVDNITSDMRNYVFVQAADGDLYLIKDSTKSGGIGDVIAVTDHTLINVGDGVAYFEECLYWQNDFTNIKHIDKISTRNILGACSIDEYDNAKAEIEDRVDRVIMGERCDRFDYFVNCGATDLSMTWDDAVAYLETGEWNKQEESDTIPVSRAVSLSEGTIYAQGRNGISFMGGNMFVISAPFGEQVEIKEITKVDEYTYSIIYIEGSNDKNLTLYLPGKDITEIPADEMDILSEFDRDFWSAGFTFDFTNNKLHGYMAIYNNALGRVCAMSSTY